MEGAYSGESMMNQAQQVWSMLDDMAENDPRAYRAFLDKQMAERKEFMTPPEPHMCVQTQMVKPQKVPFFINFCTWKRIPPPANPEEPVKVAGSAVGQINDDRGNIAVTAVAFNEKILNEFGKNATSTADQDTLIQIAMDFIEKQHSHIRLNRKYKILERTHKGSVKLIQESLFQAFQTKDKEYEDNLENVLKNFAPLATESPEALIGQINIQNDESESKKGSSSISDKIPEITLNTKPVKKGLIEEVSNTVMTLPEPIYDLSIAVIESKSCFLLKINLPGVKSVAECELDISKDDVSLFVEGKYELKLTLPSPIVDSDATAKFIKKSAVLSITMPINE